MLSLIRTSINKTNIGIVAELNGSARTLSIDNVFLKSLGVKIKIINGRPRQITHKIIPEGESLNLCKSELEKAHKMDSAFILGYVPDNDGDRGNIVYIHRKTGKAHILHSQEVFALACMAELSYMVFQNSLTYNAGIMPDRKTAVVVNGPTSLRIDKIAGAFGAEVLRAEVGEANVVNLASGLRDNGYIVRILGEGSNGGNITHPAAVRDPINTVFALLKLLLLRSGNDKEGLFEIWCKKSAQMNKYNKDFSITDILTALPSFVTTDSSETRAVMKIKTENHGILKEKYRKIFKTQWIEKKAMLEKEFGILYYEELWLQGTKVNKEPDIKSAKGGFKILFKDKNHQDTGFIWMRGSGTEPVFRVLADIEGNDPEKEELLLNWHKQMIEKADGINLP